MLLPVLRGTSIAKAFEFSHESSLAAKISQILARHHSNDVGFQKELAMASQDAYPWRCGCGRLNGKKHTFCPACKKHWSTGEPHSSAPKSPRASNSQSQWDWGWNTNQHTKPRRGRGKAWNQADRSESARRRKGEGKGKGNKGGANEPNVQSGQNAAFPPWPTQETATSSQQEPIPPALSASVQAGVELLAAVRKSYPDITCAPDHIKKAVDKADKATSKALSKYLNRASNQVGKAARQFASVKEARNAHRQNWLKHLRDSVNSWQKQLQLFKDQQKEYGDQLLQAQQELTTARRHLQQLNKQAAEVGAPVSADAGDVGRDSADGDNGAAFEAEATALVLQVQESLQQSIAAAAEDSETMEINSDEEADRKHKRPRSMEPFGVPTAPLGDGHVSSPPS